MIWLGALESKFNLLKLHIAISLRQIEKRVLEYSHDVLGSLMIVFEELLFLGADVMV
jgi:hypothetical protein